MAQFTPSDSVLLHGEVFSEKIKQGWKLKLNSFLLGFLLFGIGLAVFVFEEMILVSPGIYFNHYYEVTDLSDFLIWLLVLEVGIMFCYGGYMLCSDKGFNFSGHYYLLMDDKNLVGLNTLAITILEAAVIANIDKGFVKAEILDDGDVLITPTDLEADWPADSIEDRLNFVLPTTLRNIIREWIGAKSSSPGRRIVLKARIGLIVRGIIPKNAKTVIDTLRQQSLDMQLLTKEMLLRVSAQEPELSNAIYASIQNAADELLHTPKGPHDNFREKDAWEAEAHLDRYEEFRYTTKMPVLMAINLFVAFICCITLLILNLPQYRYIIFFSILVGILGQLDHFLRNFPNPTSRKWKAKYLDRFIDPDARARVEKTFVQAKFNPVRYYLPAIVISGIVVCIPFFIFPVSGFWGVVSGIILYGLIISKYLSDRSKRKKAKNQRLLGEILVELDQSKNTINPQAGSVVNTIRHEGAITSIPFSIEKHDALELQIEGASYKTLFNSHKQMIHQKIIEPYHILTLRVFQSEHMENFLSLIKNWFYLGSIMRLNGPDTVDDKSHTKEDFLNKMIKDNEELDKALADLQFLPDRKGEYAINAMQCTNATWKEAIQALIDKAHIIVMDLSAISIYNQGITYELAKVVNEIPLKKVVMLMDNTTDEKVLHAMLKKICENITVDSPNVNGNGIVFQLLNTGGAEERKKYESEYAWRKRTAIRVNEMQLMSYLFSVTDKLKV